MTITIRVPSALRSYSDGASELLLPSTSAATVRAALAHLEGAHSELYRSVCDETGAVRRHVNVFVNASLVHGAEGLDTPLAPGDVVAIFQAVSGG